MGKRFEGDEPTFSNMVEAFLLLGLGSELGPEGPATAFAERFGSAECLEFSVIPGAFTAKEIEQLRAWAA